MDDGESSKAEFAAVDGPPNRARSGSANSGHKRSLSGSLLSRLSFLRMSQATQSESGTQSMEQDGDSEDIASSSITAERTASGKAMSAVIQQQRRTRRRRGSLRKTALLGTRLESRDKRAAARSAEVIRGESVRHHTDDVPRSLREQTSPTDDFNAASGSFDDDGAPAQPSWFSTNTAQKIIRSSVARRRQGLPAHNNMLGEETGTDDEELMSFPRMSANSSSVGPGGTNKNASTSALHIPTQSSGSESYGYPLSTDAAYRPVHRKSSPLATHSVEMKSNSDISWDYSETEWWGWIILIVTWLVFVVGMGSCFEVWSWAWDVGETPYAPPELEDDPTLPIVGYYPALIILTAVMSWVWVVVAWVGMKYFKHANISGDDS
ncbi:hypothetical protein N7532_011602 [Penicillium argentinense]|uniref:Uncharacterized protein n=1 Tax=Penicillium argentinense TaxID=1131581 RepID=A0A9W9JUQ0_9EURO|nr:uncharacterized protein N7532_011602 [Penicillium argentinense]KAJ5082559.1 hypothetical protein N7532_011602 [Penicillium argentinense]